MSVTTVIQHRVRDYDTWHAAHDGFADAQKAGGVTSESVHRASDDPNHVLVIHGFGTPGDAEKFLGDTQLGDAMRQAGVECQPRIEIYQDA